MEKIIQNSLSKSALVRLLRSFTKEEIRDFDKFIHSTYHNNRTEVVRFFAAIKTFYPAFDGSGFSDKLIYSKVHPGKRYKDSEMRLLKAYLKKAAEAYLSIKDFRENKPAAKLFLIESLYSRKLFDLMETEMNTLEKELSEAAQPDEMHIFYRRELGSSRNNLLLNRGKRLEVLHNMGPIAENDICYFLMNLFVDLIAINVGEHDYKVSLENNIASKFLKDFDVDKFMENIFSLNTLSARMVESMYYAYKCSVDFRDVRNMDKLKEYIDKYSDKFNRKLVLNLYVSLSSAYNMNPDAKYLRKDFEITKEKLSKNLVSQTEEGYLEIVDITSIIIKAAQLGEFKWAEDFIKEFDSRIFPGVKDEVRSYCSGLIEFYKGNFERVLKYIDKVNIDVFDDQLRTLKCFCFYSLGYTEELFSLIDAYRHYLSNNKLLSAKKKKRTKNFLVYLKKLAVEKERNDPAAILLFKENILNGDIRNKSWFVQQIDILLNKSANPR